MQQPNFPNLTDPNYIIEALLGKGGGGEVYKAWHKRLEKYVALKRVRDNFKPDARIEADMLKNLKHEGLPQVYDFLVDESGIYTVMEFIPGESLAQKIKHNEKPFPQQVVIPWARALSNALVYLHSRKPMILHSDIKPANIMFTEENKVCLIDFNIALALDGQSGDVMGISHGYASPEQYGPQVLPRALRIVEVDTTEKLSDVRPQISSSARERQKIRIDARSDIYSLGATLYHMLTGERPAIASGEVKPLGQFSLALSEPLIYIIEKCMERDPAKRFQTAEELHRALCDIHKLDSRWKRQNRYRMLAVFVLSGLFVLSGTAAAYGWRLMGQETVAAFNQWVHQIPAADSNAPFLEATALFPHNPEAHRAEALRLFNEGRFEESAAFVAGYMARLSAFSWTGEDLLLIGDMFYIQGNAWFELGDYPFAAVAYAAAITNNPTVPVMHRDYAISLARMGHVSEAEGVLANIADMVISMDSVYLLRGEIAHARNHHEEAIYFFHRVLSVSGDARIRQRAILIGERTYAQMPGYEAQRVNWLLYGRDNLPAVYQAALYHPLADAFIHTGDYQEAITIFTRLRVQGNISFTLAQNIGLLHQRAQNFPAARDIFTELTTLHPGDYRPFMRLAFLVLEEQTARNMYERDFHEVLYWYAQSRALYENRPRGAGDDPEIQMLNTLIDELHAFGWLEGEE